LRCAHTHIHTHIHIHTHTHTHTHTHKHHLRDLKEGRDRESERKEEIKGR
jgi:hypothetical protein